MPNASVKIVCVKVNGKFVWLAGVVFRYIRVVRSCLPWRFHPAFPFPRRDAYQCLLITQCSTPVFLISRARPRRDLATSNNVPDPTRTALGIGFGSSQKHPKAVQRPFSRKGCDNLPIGFGAAKISLIFSSSCRMSLKNVPTTFSPL